MSTPPRDTTTRTVAKSPRHDVIEVYRGFEISRLPSYAPDGYSYVHINYNGPEDHRLGWAVTVADCRLNIDERFFDGDAFPLTASDYLATFLDTSDPTVARTALIHLLETLAERVQGAATDYKSDGASDDEIRAWDDLAESLDNALRGVER